MVTDLGCEEGLFDGLKGMHMQLVDNDGRRWWDRAIAAGCRDVMPYERQFWGNDWELVEASFGIQWAILQPGEAA